MQFVVVLALLVASTQAFLFGPGGLFGAPAGGCDPCAAARAPYYPPQPQYQPQPAYQPQPQYQPQPAYNSGYQTAPVQQTYQQPAQVQSYQQPAPAQSYQTVSEPVAQTSGGAGAYAQPPPPPSYATGPSASAGYKRFH